MNECEVNCPKPQRATRKEHVAPHINCVILLFLNESLSKGLQLVRRNIYFFVGNNREALDELKPSSIRFSGKIASLHSSKRALTEERQGP